jgi:hypothetical protein
MPAERYRVLRKGNVVAGMVIILIALTMYVLSTDPIYPLSARIASGIAGTAFVALAVRAWQPSVTVAGSQVTVRRWLRSCRLSISDVREVAVVDTWDGPIEVRKLVIVTHDDRVLKSHFQSRRSLREGHLTASDRAAEALSRRIVS